MALLGKLKGFNIADIFQLISQQAKTGSLTLQLDNKNAVLYFRDGVITGVNSNIWATDPRPQLLYQAGIIRQEVFTALSNGNSQKVFNALVSQGLLDKSKQDKATFIVVVSLIIEVFQWPEGNYSFEEGVGDQEAVINCNIPAEGLILNALRIIDEWDTAREVLPDRKDIPVKMTRSGATAGQPDMNEKDLNVYERIDGKLTIQDIINLSFETEFETQLSLNRLFAADLIEYIANPAEKIKDRSVYSGRYSTILLNGLSYFIILLFLALLFIFGNPRVARLEEFKITSVEKNINDQKTVLNGLSNRGIGPLWKDKDRYGR